MTTPTYTGLVAPDGTELDLHLKKDDPPLPEIIPAEKPDDDLLETLEGLLPLGERFMNLLERGVAAYRSVVPAPVAPAQAVPMMAVAAPAPAGSSIEIDVEGLTDYVFKHLKMVEGEKVGDLMAYMKLPGAKQKVYDTIREDLPMFLKLSMVGEEPSEEPLGESDGPAA